MSLSYLLALLKSISISSPIIDKIIDYIIKHYKYLMSLLEQGWTIQEVFIYICRQIGLYYDMIVTTIANIL